MEPSTHFLEMTTLEMGRVYLVCFEVSQFLLLPSLFTLIGGKFRVTLLCDWDHYEGTHTQHQPLYLEIDSLVSRDAALTFYDFELDCRGRVYPLNFAFKCI